MDLNFDKKGSKHQTLCGGISTIALYILMIAIVGTRFQKLGDDYDGYEFLSFIGGLMYFYYVILDTLIKPISAHSFNMRALKRLYFARTSKPDNLGLERP